MDNIALVVLVYGALVLIGGVMGWAKAKSVPSLLSGVTFGLALLIAGYFIHQGTSVHSWMVVAAVLAAVLLFVMGLRFAKTKKFMPAGLVAVMSLIVLVLIVLKL